MDSGQHIPSLENMDPTLSELGNEFTLGDIDGKKVVWVIVVFLQLQLLFPLSPERYLVIADLTSHIDEHHVSNPGFNLDAQ